MKHFSALLYAFVLCSCALSQAKDTSSRTPQSANYGELSNLGLIVNPDVDVDRNLFDVFEVSVRVKGSGAVQLLQNRMAGPRVDVILDIYNKEIEINSLALFPYEYDSGRLGQESKSLYSYPWVTTIDDEEIQGVKKIATTKNRLKIDGQIYVDIRVSAFNYSGGYYSSSKPTMVVKERLGKTQSGQWESSNAQSDFQYVVTIKKL